MFFAFYCSKKATVCQQEKGGALTVLSGLLYFGAHLLGCFAEGFGKGGIKAAI